VILGLVIGLVAGVAFMASPLRHYAFALVLLGVRG
jgi:hypothetical protein